MTIKSSGSLSLQEINAEFGLGTNLNAYRGVKWWLDNNTTGNFPTGQITFNDFYSKRATSPVVPGTATYSIPGTFNFTVPLYNTLTVKLYGAGGGGGGSAGTNVYYSTPNQPGGAGGSSRWDGGTASGKPQANGGAGGGAGTSGLGGAGGTASGGDTNVSGGGGSNGTSAGSAYFPAPGNGSGGTAARDSIGDGGRALIVSTFTGYGTSTQASGGGGGGGYSEKTYAAGAYAPGSTVQVVVGAKGVTYGTLGPEDGRAVITWS